MRVDSVIDLPIRAPRGTTIGKLVALREFFEAILARSVDLITYGALKPVMDDDIRREAVLV